MIIFLLELEEKLLYCAIRQFHELRSTVDQSAQIVDELEEGRLKDQL